MSLLLLARAAAAHRAGPFDPSQLFAGGIRGGWYDPSDFATLWQDAAGTTPVTAVGQSVGKIADKSGNGNHLTQATSGKRPVLAQDGGGYYYLQFTAASSQCLDGTSGSGLQAGTDPMVLSVGARFDNSSDGTLVARSKASGVAGRYYFARFASEGGIEISLNRTGISQGNVAISDTSTAVRVITGSIDRNGTSQSYKIEDSTLGSNTNSVFGDPDSSIAYRFLLGAYNDSSDTGEVAFFDGRIYSLIARFAAFTSAQVSDLRTWQGSKCGITV